MKLRDLTDQHIGRSIRITHRDKTHEGEIRHLGSQEFPGRDDRLAGRGTPPPTHHGVKLHLDTVAWDSLDPDTEIELLD